MRNATQSAGAPHDADAAMQRLDYSAENCSVAATLSVIGEKWTLLVLREAFFGLRRYEDLQHATGCARNILGNRLTSLVKHGLLSRKPYREPGQRQRYEYWLTRKGLDLLPILVALMDWGDRWQAGRTGGPVQLRHRECRSAVHAALHCDAGHGPLSARDVFAQAGKSARRLKIPSVY